MGVIFVKPSVIKIIHLLIEPIPKTTYKDFINKLNDIGMKEVDKPFNTRGDSLILKYDKIKWFLYITDDNRLNYIKVVGVKKDILQIKVMILYKRLVLSKLSDIMNDYEVIDNLLITIYGKSLDIEMYGLKFFNFVNDKKVLYTFTDKQNDMDIITINVLNRKYYK
jgi:hypothetical protein